MIRLTSRLTHPFKKVICQRLLRDATSVLQCRVPEAVQFFVQRGWSLPTHIDRVYVIEKAMQQLQYQPVYNFEKSISSLPG